MRVKRYMKLHYLKILRLKDSPDKIAKGVALGLSLDFLPLPFVSLLVAYLIAKLARFNTMAAVMTAAFLKWAVFTIFYPMNILVGKFVVGQPVNPTVERVPVTEPGLNFASLKAFFSEETLQALGAPFLVGSAINALIFGVITYFLLKRALKFRLKKRKDKKARKEKEKHHKDK